jgi:hypothetical protein
VAFESSHDHQQLVDAALAESAKTGKKILIEYGGDWCKWSRRMEAVFSDRDIAAFIAKHFVLLRCYVGPDGAVDASSIEAPPMSSVPYFSLVGSDKAIVANQATETFEFLWMYRKSAVRRFLAEWARL